MENYMNKNLGFRAWFYFRQGWSVYFAFIFAAINTLVVTYFLAIENYPILKEIFPSFTMYATILVGIGIPVLVLIGYLHYKKSSAYKAEADITIESHPHFKRMFENMDLLILVNLRISNIIKKMSKNEKLDEKDFEEFTNLQKELDKKIKDKKLKG